MSTFQTPDSTRLTTDYESNNDVSLPRKLAVAAKLVVTYFQTEGLGKIKKTTGKKTIER